jgi:hypothetical protein
MSFIKVCLAVVFVSIVFGAPLAFATCSNASIKGTYGVLASGLNGSLQPAASLNQIVVDGLGNLSGTATKSIDGTIVTYSVTGTYSIASNCTGKATFNNQSNQTEHDNIYINNANSGGLYAGAFLIQTDSNHVQAAVAVAEGTATCTDLGVKHPYSFQATGMVVGTGQIAALGRLTLNGTGGVSGTETLSLGGAIHSAVAVTGSYTINSNCTGTAKITPTGLSPVNLSLVVVNAGKEIMAVETDTNTIVTATFQE